MVVWWRKLGEVENECTVYNFSLFSIFLPKIIKIGGNLTKFWQKQFCTVFLRHGVYISLVDYGVMVLHSVYCTLMEMTVCCVSLQTPLLNEILIPLIKDNTSVDRSYPSGSLSRRTVACKLSDVLYIVAQRIGVDLLRQYLTEPLQLFFAVFSISSSSSGPAAAQAVNSSDVMKSDSECQQTGSDDKGIIISWLYCTYRPVSSKNNLVGSRLPHYGQNCLW